jgi:hypothetical protein
MRGRRLAKRLGAVAAGWRWVLLGMVAALIVLPTGARFECNWWNESDCDVFCFDGD